MESNNKNVLLLQQHQFCSVEAEEYLLRSSVHIIEVEMVAEEQKKRNIKFPLLIETQSKKD